MTPHARQRLTFLREALDADVDEILHLMDGGVLVLVRMRDPAELRVQPPYYELIAGWPCRTATRLGG
jgi:hypothetical protein